MTPADLAARAAAAVDAIIADGSGRRGVLALDQRDDDIRAGIVATWRAIVAREFAAHVTALTAERDAALSRATAAEARGAEVRAPIYARIEAERGRQDAKWGEQNHPDVDRVLTDRKGSTRIDGAGVHRWPDGCDPERMAEEYGIPAEWRAKANCNGAAKLGQCTWAHIAVEEMAEAVHAATLAQQGRGPEEDVDAELVQLAAVVTAWIEARARRRGEGAAKGGAR